MIFFIKEAIDVEIVILFLYKIIMFHEEDIFYGKKKKNVDTFYPLVYNSILS